VIDGRRWIVNSLPQWREHFPHWRALGTIKTAFRILTEKGLILKGNHNLSKQERRLWYTVNFDHPLFAKAGYSEDKAPVKNRPMKGQKLTDEGSKIDLCKVKNGPMHRSKNGLSYKHRDNKEDIQSRLSSSPGREEDAIIDEQISRMQRKKKGEGRGNGKGVSAAGHEGEGVVLPPDPSDNRLKQIYGGVVPPAIDFTTAPPGSINLWDYLRPFAPTGGVFSKEEIRAMDRPGPEPFEAKAREFVDRMLADHFKGQAEFGYRKIALRALRGGFLNRCGFRDFCGREFYSEADAYSDELEAQVEVWEF